MIFAASDWLQLFLFIMGVLIALTISMVFFRAQQNIDFRNLNNNISNISAAIQRVELAIKLQESIVSKIDTKTDITSLKSSIDKINDDIQKSLGSVELYMLNYRREFSKNVDGMITEESTNIVAVIRDTVRRELIIGLARRPYLGGANVVPTEMIARDIIEKISKEVDIIFDSHRKTLEAQSASAIDKLEQEVVMTIRSVSEVIVELQTSLSAQVGPTNLSDQRLTNITQNLIVE